MGEMLILDKTGHSKTMWDPENAAEVSAARAAFDALKAERYVAYNVKEDGKEGAIMHSFDPQAGKVIMSPPVVGG